VSQAGQVGRRLGMFVRMLGASIHLSLEYCSVLTLSTFNSWAGTRQTFSAKSATLGGASVRGRSRECQCS